MLFPAVRLARVVPALHVRHEFPYARCVLPSGPSPCAWLFHAPSTMPDKTPQGRVAVSRLPGACFSGRALGSSLVLFPGFPICTSIAVCHNLAVHTSGAVWGFLSSTAFLFLHAKARGLRRTFAPSPFRVLSCCLRCALKPSASATSSSRSCTSTSGCASPLRPTGYSVYASPVLFAAFRRLRHGRKTRYGWVASPYPTGTFTPQETLSLSQRDNARAKGRGRAELE